MRPRIDTPSATLGEADDRRWRARRLGGYLGSLFTGLAQWFVDQTGEWLGVVGALASEFVRGAGGGGRVTGIVRPPEMDQEADEDKSSP